MLTISQNFKTVRPVVTENSPGQNLGGKKKKIITRYDYNLTFINASKPAPISQGTSWSVLLNVSYKKYHYIWFRGEDLNDFPDIKPLMK